jgi:isopenicillin N synthase-like dioxygenase
MYYRAMAALAATLMDVFAEALGLDDGFFRPLIDRHGSAMRMLHYPHQASSPPSGQLRAGAHTDYGTLTILAQDAAPGGLQVRDAAGRWVSVPHEPGAFVVNLGDLMARWTNDRWRSTLHRVVNPPMVDGSNERFSIAFFHNANWDALVTCLTEDATPKYPPIRAGAHLMAKFRSTVI